MQHSPFLFITEQVAAHLSEELRRGRWEGEMPGRNQLVKELGVSGRTVELALQHLENQGLLVRQGVGRPRRIELPKHHVAPALHVGILADEAIARNLGYIVDLRYKLEEAGHMVSFAPKTMLDLGMDVKRIRRLVMANEAKAWVVISAPRHVLEWFAEQSQPALALFGRRGGVRIAAVGPDHIPPTVAAVRRLIALGHRRIVLLDRWGARGTILERSARAALQEMERHGLRTGAYNAPTWHASPAGLRRMLDELFRVSPPTALIIDEAFLFHATKEHLAQQGILAPRDISLICVDADTTFDWCEPTVAHIRWDSRPVVQRILRWAGKVARGKEDRRQTLTKAEFVDGGTVGPVPKTS